MIQSTIQSFREATRLGRTVLALGAMLTAAMLAAPMSASAQGATVTFNNPNCTSYTLTGTAPNQTLTCVVGSGVPTGCVINGPTTGTWNTPITLTSACTGGGTATSWAWTGGNCAGVTTQSCSAIETSPTTTRTYTVTASNTTGPGNVAQTTVTWSQGGGGGGLPSNCTLTPATQTIASPGGILGLTAQCTSGTFPITHAFTGAIVGSWQQTNAASGIFIQNNYTQSTSVSVNTSNSVGIGPSNSATIIVGSGSGNPMLNCSANNFTVIPSGGATATWGQAFSTPSSSAGNFGPGDSIVWVYKLTVPAGTGFTSFGRFTISEYTEGPTPRQLSISTLPCDFRPRDITGASGPLALCSDGTTCEVYYGVTGPSSSAAGLTAGNTYYISARNWQSPGVSSCGSAHCNALMGHAPTQ